MSDRVLDGVTFEVIVSRIQIPQDARDGPWLFRLYAGGAHVRSWERISLEAGLRGVDREVRAWLDAAGASSGSSWPISAGSDE